jgi:hypothetical protein
MEEEDSTFPAVSRRNKDFLRLLPTQPANNPSPKRRIQLKTSLPKNAIVSLLLLKRLLLYTTK